MNTSIFNVAEYLGIGGLLTQAQVEAYLGRKIDPKNEFHTQVQTLSEQHKKAKVFMDKLVGEPQDKVFLVLYIDTDESDAKFAIWKVVSHK